MIKLFFEINGQFRKYTVKTYELKNDFYTFTDEIDKKKRILHKDYYKGEEVINI